MMSNDSNWNLLEKVTDDKPHIYDVNTDRELTCPLHLSMSLNIAADSLYTAIEELKYVSEKLIEHDAYIRSEVGGFDKELSEMMWRIAELYTDLFHGHSRRELKSVVNAMYGCKAESLRYNEHDYVDTDIAAEAANEEE